MSKDEDIPSDKHEELSQHSGIHRQIYYTGRKDEGFEEGDKQYKGMKQPKVVYVLNIKLKDTNPISIEVTENDNIEELVEQIVQYHKLSKEMQEALQIHIKRKLEQIK